MVKKCHGNRSLQRFKQRCRARGKNAKQVEQLVKKRSFIRRKQARLANITDNATVPTTNAVSSQNEEKERERKTMRPCFSVTFTWHRFAQPKADDKVQGNNETKAEKRKRDALAVHEQTKDGRKSASQWSIAQPLPKKRKNCIKGKTNSTDVNKHYRFVFVFERQIDRSSVCSLSLSFLDGIGKPRT